ARPSKRHQSDASRQTSTTRCAEARRLGKLSPRLVRHKTGETWSGRGRAPSWIGKNRERFLIQK
ncbi:H-NS family nucleoid-associated regulatory protein, partial [Mycetohabitans sp. B6]|uniref:H-NS family nucleoid-associated regulatory protein n=1 Tax=Mycetohabitans sp. B6 TaxID=2841843 RepID=UPI001F003BB9